MVIPLPDAMLVLILYPAADVSSLRISDCETFRSATIPGCATWRLCVSITFMFELIECESGMQSQSGAFPNQLIGQGFSVSLMTGNFACQYGLGPS